MNPTMFDVFFKPKNSLPTLSAVLAMSYLAYVLTTLVFLPASKKVQSGFQAKPAQTAIAAQVSEDKPVEYREIANWHLFGQADAAVASGGEVLETQLQLKLQGLLTTSKQHNHAHAIITTAEQSQKAYKINDELPGGAILKAIENDKVIILRNNQQESLSLERQQPE